VSDRGPSPAARVAGLAARLDLLSWAVVVGSVLLLPRWLSPFWLQTGLFAMAAAVAAIGLTLLVGTAGQLSLGHAFFVAVGAYGYAYLAGEGTSVGVGGADGLGWPPVAAALSAVAIAGALGAVFSPLASRLRGIYLGIATLGLVFVGLHLLRNVEAVQPVSGGVNGRGVATFTAAGRAVDELTELWYLGLAGVAVAYWFARNVQRGRPGRALEAVRDSEVLASVMGVRVGAAKAAAFTVSSVYAGLAGVLLALTYRHIVPETFGFLYSIDLLAMVVIGGLGSVAGAVLGAAFVTILPLTLNHYADEIPVVEPVGGGGFDAATLARVAYGTAVVVALVFPDALPRVWRHVSGLRQPPARPAATQHQRAERTA
jgi:branched-chain amino acid transport system permease protein